LQHHGVTGQHGAYLAVYGLYPKGCVGQRGFIQAQVKRYLIDAASPDGTREYSESFVTTK